MGRPRTPKGRAGETVARLAEAYPGDEAELCALVHDGPFQLMVATILSAQSTDEGVNKVTPTVFATWPTPADLAAADPAHVEEAIKTLGLFRSKARSLVGMAAALEESFGGQVPRAMADLTTLPGVGRKTANVVRSVGFGLPGLPVDTHVGRLARRLGLTSETDPVRAEADLDALVPAADRGRLSLRLILHGRRVCLARSPRCGSCLLADFCPSAGRGAVPAPPGGGRRKRGAEPGTREGGGALR
ncbi:MAG: endonuclease III [Acidimicrobiales bacterium]